MTKDEAIRLIDQFEAGTLPKAEWTHEAHFIAAAWYCLNNPLPQAIEKIRNNLKNYNLRVGGQNTDSSGYHETITLFYMTRITQYLIAANMDDLTDQTLKSLLQQPFLAREYIHRFYSKELLTSVQARRNWVEADIQQTDSLPPTHSIPAPAHSEVGSLA